MLSPQPSKIAKKRRAEYLNAALIEADRRFLVSRTEEIVETETQVSCNLEWLLAYLGRSPRK